MRVRSAFSLIELLVVISIIALLIGLLVPALASAREASRTAACLSNNRQMSIATVNYAFNHNGFLPTVGFSHGGEALPQQGSWFFLLQEFSSSNLAWRCPSDDSPAWETPEGNPPRLRRVSYATSFIMSGLISGNRFPKFNNLLQVPAPASTVYIAELAEQSPQGFATADHYHPEQWFGNPATREALISQQLEIHQHNGKANYAFLDGHASTESLTDVFEVSPEANGANRIFTRNFFWPDIAR